MAERAEESNKGAVEAVAYDTGGNLRIDYHQPCPILRQAGIYEGQAYDGREFCLNCPYEECVYDELDRRKS